MLNIRVISLFLLITNLNFYCFHQNIFGVKLNKINIKVKENPFSYENILILLKSLWSLYSSIEFIDTFKYDFDVDGLLGVRILSDQLNITLQILNLYENERTWSQILRNTLQDLKEQSDQLLITALPQIISNDENYFNEVGAILEEGLWSHIPTKRLSVNKSKEYDSVLDLEEIVLNENVSDYCISLMLQKCYFSQFCWDVMTRFGYTDYPLSHQVFFLEMSKKKCPKSLSSIEKSVDNLLTTFCSNMYFENKRIERKLYPEEFFDLFMENIVFCGIIGFKEFTENKNWLRKIVSQQNSFGCFTKKSQNLVQKRREKVLKNGCSSHKTSMALASTVVYIRDIILELIFMSKI